MIMKANGESEELPPHDQDAEEEFLGGLLCAEAPVIEDGLSAVSAEEFYVPGNRRLFTVLSETFAENGSINVVTVNDRLARENIAKRVPSPGMLIERCKGGSSVQNAIKLLREKAIEREVWKLAHGALTMMGNGEKGSTILADILERADAISTRNLQGESPEVDLADAMETIGREALEGEPREIWGLRTGVGEGALDELTGGIQAKQLWLLAGLASMGKSTLINAICRGIRTHHPEAGFPLIISTEMSPQAIARTSLAAEAGVHTKALDKRNLGPLQREAVEKSLRARLGAGIKIRYMGGRSLQEMKIAAKSHKRRYGLPLMVVDMASGLNAKGKSIYEKVSAISQGLKNMREELDTCIIACVHLNRAVFAEGTDRKPKLHHLRDTGEWEQNADRVLFIHRSGYHGEKDSRTEIIQAKDRTHGDKDVSIFLEWKRATGSYHRVAEVLDSFGAGQGNPSYHTD